MDVAMRATLHYHLFMNTIDIRSHLGGINVTEFSQRHKLALRTLMRIKAGGKPASATAKVVADAIRKDMRRTRAKQAVSPGL